MADINPITPVASGIQPTPQMSLVDMMNLARGSQAYQQAAQVNPYLAKQAQQQTRTGEIALSVEEQKNKERLDMQTFFSNPANYQTNGRIDIDKINAEVPKYAPLTGSEYINKMSTLSTAQTNAIDAKQKLTQDQRSMIGQRFSILGRMGVQDKNAYIKEMDLLKQENPDNSDLHKLIDAYKVTWNEMPSGPDLPGKAIAGAQTLLTPAQQQTTFAPQAGTLATGAEIKQTVTTPSVGGQAPKIEVGGTLAYSQLPPGSRMTDTGTKDLNNNSIFNVFDANGRALGQTTVPLGVAEEKLPGAAPATTQPAGAAEVSGLEVSGPVTQKQIVGTPITAAAPVLQNAPVRLPEGLTAAQQIKAGTEVAPGMRLPYTVRSASQPFLAEPSEEKDKTAGADYRNRLIDAQGKLTQGRRNVEEVIQTASGVGEKLIFPGGGIMGRLEQKALSALRSSEYDMLAKDLAQMALSNATAMGGAGGTVAGLDMNAVANGTIKVPPEVLIKIARRGQADQTNIDMQATGAQKFSEKYGDNNMKAYQQAWNANADSKIFEAMNITRDIADPAKQKAELNRLFPNPNQYKDFLKKYQNIKKLSETGSL
jgi:hypothetical protein